MANILYKRHNCILTPHHKNQLNQSQVRRGIVRKQVINSVKRVHSSTTVKNIKPINFKRRRSISLTNLSIIQSNSDMTKPNSSNTEEKKIREEMCNENLEPLVKDQCDLAKQVCKMFILNAWRHRRQEAIKAKLELRQTETQMDNLNIQIVVLRSLLESEKNRVATSMNETTHYRVMLEDEARQREKLKRERDENRNTLQKMEESLQDAETELCNLKNELLTCKSEQSAFEQQMEREREKLGKYKEDKKLLLEKLKLAEESSATKQTQINNLLSENQELKQLLFVEKEINKSSETTVIESLEKLDVLEKNKSCLSKEVNILKSTNSQLEERIKSLEVALTKKNKENCGLATSCQEQMLEMSHLRANLAQLQTSNWMSRLSRLASVLIHIPISILFHNLDCPIKT